MCRICNKFIKASVIGEGIGLGGAKRVLHRFSVVFLVNTFEKDTAMFKIMRKEKKGKHLIWT